MPSEAEEVAHSALAVRADQAKWTTSQLAALRSLGIEEVDAGTLDMYLNFCQRSGLDPFAGQIHLIGRWDGKKQRTKYTIQTSIDGMRIVAQRTHEYAGSLGPWWCGRDGQWTDVWLHPEPPAAARVGVMRRGFAEPVYGVALWSEYAQDTPTWKKLKAVMIAKCAEAIALRKAFPHDLSGLYSGEEMDQAGTAVTGSSTRVIEAAEPEVILTANEVLLSVAMALTDDEYRRCWQAANRANILEDEVTDTSDGEVLTIANFIVKERGRTRAEANEQVMETVEVVEVMEVGSE